MNKAEKRLHDRVIKLLPSADLRAAVAEQNFEFGYLDILKFIQDYAPSFDNRLALFTEAASVFTDKQEAKHALKLIEFNKRVYAEFVSDDPNAVYEVDIKCDPWDEEETYIVKTFGDALATIKAFISHYKDVGARDNEFSRYILTKKTAIRPTKPSDLRNKIGDIGQCVLGKGLKVKSVDMYRIGCCEYRCGKKDCLDCKRPCVWIWDPDYPKFIEKYDLVAWHTGSYRLTDIDKWRSAEGHSDLEYGIFALDMTECRNDSYVVLLDNKYIKERRAQEGDPENGYPVYYEHSHPTLAEVFKPDFDSLPQEVKDDYLYASEALKKIDLNISISRVTDDDL